MAYVVVVYCHWKSCIYITSFVTVLTLFCHVMFYDFMFLFNCAFYLISMQFVVLILLCSCNYAPYDGGFYSGFINR